MDARARRLGVGISGSYGGWNLGDEAILRSMLTELRRGADDLETTVLSRDAADTLRRHAVDHAYTARALSRSEARDVVAGLDLMILGGGGILYDLDAEGYLREIFLASELGVPSMVFAVSAGPLVGARVRERVREGLEAASVVTVRERASRKLLEDLGVRREIEVTADPALLLEPEPLSLEEILQHEAIDPEATLIGFSVREPGPAAPDLDVARYHQLLADAADYVVDRLDAEVVFFPLERRITDVQHSHGIVARMRHAQHATVLKREYTPGQIVSLLGHFDLAIGMRLHFLIFSALADLPFVALPYATKVSAFLEDLGVDGPDVGSVGTGELIAHIDRVWDSRHERSARVREALTGLRERARRNTEHALRLLAARRSTRADLQADRCGSDGPSS